MDSGLIDEFLAEASHELSAGQKLLTEKDGVTIVSKKVQGSEQALIKAWGSIPGPTHAVYRALCEVDERRQWDKNATDLRVVDHIDANTTINYSLLPGIFGMQPRDFVDMRHMVVLPNGTHIIVFCETEHEACPLKDGVVRGTTIISGQHIKPIDQNSCMLTAVTQVDIKGSIPSYLVNKVASRSPIEWFHALRVHLQGCVQVPVAATVSSDLDYLQSKLMRCNRTQLITVVRSLAEQRPRLVPVIAAGVSSAMAKRAETEFMISYAFEAMARLDAVGVEALALGSKQLDCSDLVLDANSRTDGILADTKHVLAQSSTGYNPTELQALLELNTSLRTQVNNYSEAIYTQALNKAMQCDEVFEQHTQAHSDGDTYSKRLSRWWYGQEEEEPQKMKLPQVNSKGHSTSPRSLQIRTEEEEEEDPAEEFEISSLGNVLAIAEQLSKKLELTSVKKLLRLAKYRAFSFGELTQVSNGHIANTMKRIRQITQQVKGWEAAEHVFTICASNAQLAKKLNDFSEVINKDISHHSPLSNN